MKKPNITEGEWEYRESAGGKPWVRLGETTTDISQICYSSRIDELDQSAKEQEANAQAISAVPDMMDALCMVWEELESKEDWGEDLSPSQIHQIHKALLKAGVEI